MASRSWALASQVALTLSSMIKLEWPFQEFWSDLAWMKTLRTPSTQLLQTPSEVLLMPVECILINKEKITIIILPSAFPLLRTPTLLWPHLEKLRQEPQSLTTPKLPPHWQELLTIYKDFLQLTASNLLDLLSTVILSGDHTRQTELQCHLLMLTFAMEVCLMEKPTDTW